MPRVFILGCLMVGLYLPWSPVRAADSPKDHAVATTKDDKPRSKAVDPERAKANAARTSRAKRPMVVVLALSGNYPERAGIAGPVRRNEAHAGRLSSSGSTPPPPTRTLPRSG